MSKLANFIQKALYPQVTASPQNIQGFTTAMIKANEILKNKRGTPSAHAETVHAETPHEEQPLSAITRLNHDMLHDIFEQVTGLPGLATPLIEMNAKSISEFLANFAKRFTPPMNMDVHEERGDYNRALDSIISVNRFFRNHANPFVNSRRILYDVIRVSSRNKNPLYKGLSTKLLHPVYRNLLNPEEKKEYKQILKKMPHNVALDFTAFCRVAKTQKLVENFIPQNPQETKLSFLRSLYAFHKLGVEIPDHPNSDNTPLNIKLLNGLTQKHQFKDGAGRIISSENVEQEVFPILRKSVLWDMPALKTLALNPKFINFISNNQADDLSAVNSAIHEVIQSKSPELLDYISTDAYLDLTADQKQTAKKAYKLAKEYNAPEFIEMLNNADFMAKPENLRNVILHNMRELVQELTETPALREFMSPNHFPLLECTNEIIEKFIVCFDDTKEGQFTIGDVVKKPDFTPLSNAEKENLFTYWQKAHANIDDFRELAQHDNFKNLSASRQSRIVTHLWGHHQDVQSKKGGLHLFKKSKEGKANKGYIDKELLEIITSSRFGELSEQAKHSWINKLTYRDPNATTFQIPQFKTRLSAIQEWNGTSQ